MTCANVLVGRVKDCEGIEIGRCWTEGWECSDLRRSAKRATSWTAYDHSRGGNFNPRSREGSDSRKSTRKPASRYFNPRSGAARHIALHELLGVQYACQEDHFELQQTAENISQIL